MTQLALHHSSSWFKKTGHALTTIMLGCAILGSSSVWAVDPSVKELRIGFQKSSINFAIAKQQNLYEKPPHFLYPKSKLRFLQPQFQT